MQNVCKINLCGFLPLGLNYEIDKCNNSAKIIAFLFFNCCFIISINAQKSAASVAENLKKCTELNARIEEENDHNIWVKGNAELERISTQNLQNIDLSASQRTKFRRFLAIAFLNNGAYNTYVDNYAESISSYKKSLEITLADKNHELSASNYQNIATAHDFLGNLDSTLAYLQIALVFAKNSRNESSMAYVLTDLGYTYKNIGDYTKAINNNIKALKIFEKLRDKPGIERTYFAIARIFYDQREYQKSENYYLKGLEIAQKSKDYVRQCLILNGLANVRLMVKDYGEFERYANKSLMISRTHGLQSSEGMTHQIVGEAFLSRGEPIRARENLKKAAAIFSSLGNENYNSQVLILLAKTFFPSKDYAAAEPLLRKAHAQAKQNKFPGVLKEAAELLAQLKYAGRDYKTAFDFQQEARKMSDSLFRDENKNAALKAEFSYQNEIKERQLIAVSQQKQIAELRSERQNILIYSILAGILLLSSFTYFAFKGFKVKNENELLTTKLEATEHRLKMEERANESELKALKSQMNPHFMFNALNSIQEQFMYGDKNVANEQMGNFTYLTRQILSVSGKKKIKLATEIEILTKYLELEKMRFAEGFSFAISTAENIDEDYHEIPPMLIQPFVENSVKHGLLHKQGDKFLSVCFDLNADEENLVCTIKDNGIGREKSAEINRTSRQGHESFSTAATNERLKLMAKNLYNQDFIVYQDLKNSEGVTVGTQVVISIPLF